MDCYPLYQVVSERLATTLGHILSLIVIGRKSNTIYSAVWQQCFYY